MNHYVQTIISEMSARGSAMSEMEKAMLSDYAFACAQQTVAVSAYGFNSQQLRAADERVRIMEMALTPELRQKAAAVRAEAQRNALPICMVGQQTEPYYNGMDVDDPKFQAAARRRTGA